MTARLRLVRRQAGMTLGALAGQAELTESYLSKIERGLSTPSIAVALRLAEALGVEAETLFGSDPVEGLVTVVRAGERTRLGRSDQGARPGYEAIATSLVGKQMLPFMVTPAPMGTTVSFREHAGEEFLFVHKGRVEVEFPTDPITLTVGDCAYFPGDLPHRLHSTGRTAAHVLVVVSRAAVAATVPLPH